MNEKEKYFDMLNKLNEKFTHYEETDNTEVIKTDIWTIDDYVVCINNNFMINDPTHGIKDGLTFGKIYKIESIPELDMINIKNDLEEIVPYYVWRFLKVKFREN